VPRPGVNSTAIVDAGRTVLAMLAQIREGAGARATPLTAGAAARLRTEAEASEYASLYGSL